MTRKIVLTFIASAVVAAGCARGQTTQATQPDQLLSPDLERVLDRLEARDRSLDSLRAKMKYERNQTLVGEITHREGSITYLRKWESDPAAPKPPDPKDPHAGQRERVFFRVQFDTLVTAGYKSTKKETFSFDGRWLHELNEKTRMLIHRQIVGEDRVLNPTRLGRGPFPAPFGQKKKDVLDNFSVRLVPPDPKDPPDTDHLELLPKSGTELARTYRRIELFVSRKLDLPARMVTENRSEEIVTADFADIQVNPRVEEAEFELKKPPGFAEETERLQPDPTPP